MNMFSCREVSPQRDIRYPETVKIEGGVNTHTHPRGTDAVKDGRAEMHIPRLADVYEVALCMGNTVPPLITRRLAYRQGVAWRKIIPADRPLQLKIGGLMTENTSPEDVIAGYDQPEGRAAWDYMKMFVRAASNASGADVDDMRKVIPVLKAMTHTKFKHRRHPMTLAIHMERKYDPFGRRINFLRREQESVDRDLSFLLNEVPDARVVVCHVCDRYTLEVIRYLRARGFNIWGELAPHYSVYCCDDLFEAPDGGTKFVLDRFCLPIFHTEEDRRANEEAMLSGEDCWIHGCDEACWPDDPTQPKNVKVDNKGLVTGGQTQDPKANISWVVEKFIEAGKLHLINGYLSRNARKAYGLDFAHTTLRLKRQDWKVEEVISREAPRGTIKARVAMGGQERKYLPEHLAA